MQPFKSQGLRSFRHIVQPSRPQICSAPRRKPTRPPQHVRPFHHTSRRRYQPAGSSQEATQDMVHVHRPLINRKKIGLYIFYGVGTYVMLTLVLKRLAEALDIDLEEEPVADETAKDDEGSIFIPFQYPQPTNRTFYKDSDEDWQEFAKWSRSPERLASVKEELAARCLRDVSAAPKLKTMLGKDIKLSQYWLDVKYPDGPPPEYTRYGVEITDEYIAWGQQTVPHSHYVQLRHLLWPTAVYAAAYNGLTIFSHLQLIKAKRFLGIPLSHKDNHISAVSKIEAGRLQMEAIQARIDSRKEESDSQRQQLEKQLHEPKDAAKSSIPFLSTRSNTTSPSSPPTSLVTASSDVVLSWKIFLQTLAIMWQRSRLDDQPKGAFYVVGEVAVIGDRGWVRCDVKAAYDPKAAKIVYCICSVRYFWEHKQRPKGGS